MADDEGFAEKRHTKDKGTSWRGLQGWHAYDHPMLSELRRPKKEKDCLMNGFFFFSAAGGWEKATGSGGKTTEAAKEIPWPEVKEAPLPTRKLAMPLQSLAPSQCGSFCGVGACELRTSVDYLSG